MKKALLLILILTATVVMVHSEGIELGDFPLGKWLDAKWSAVWEFRSGNIRIQVSTTKLSCLFRNKN